eukprot:Pompholyxophrys_sp_v1_NODE_52_length_2935_cov_10.414931.p2 type:complete len:349 gc:universal NODE_52_length_2935_cov_10.414931:454-1500(+)
MESDRVVECVKSRACEQVKFHVIYAVMYLGFPQQHVAQIFSKSRSSISKWVSRFQETGEVSAPGHINKKKFGVHHRQWVENFVHNAPLSYLKEVREEFIRVFGMEISSSTIFNMLQEAQLTHRVIEKRALEISFDDIARFNYEINLLRPLPEQLCFIDEMSTDNRSMNRRRGWFVRGHRPVFKGAFRRGVRISVLSFLCVDGVFETFGTNGTFDRENFFHCCQTLLNSGKVNRYPGSRSIWILDGASIHVDKAMVDYFWARGVRVLYLPAYCPFFNPIEIIFGLIKRRCRALYQFDKGRTELELLMKVLAEFLHYDCSNIFEKCGYMSSGYFNVHTNFDDYLTLADLI